MYNFNKTLLDIIRGKNLYKFKVAPAKKNRPKPYYILVAEWKYPDGPGKAVLNSVYNSKQDALIRASELCEKEIRNFEEKTHCDSLWPAHCCKDKYDREGYMISPKNGLDEWFYFVRVVELYPID